MAMMVADTDVLIDALHGKEPARTRIDIELGTGRLATTVVTVFELLSGARRPSQRASIEPLLAAMTILGLDPDSAQLAARLRRDLERTGQGIGMADYLIAGICISHQAMLITRNREHFQRIHGLVLSTLDQ